MKIRVVDTDSALDALEESWNRLSEKTAPNFFSSFDYVRTAWRHFRGPSDRLHIVVLSEGPSIVGIAPFYVEQSRIRRIPHRAIKWIPEWEGDRPRLLVDGNEEILWHEILRFFNRRYRSCEVLDLVEQPMNGPEGRGWSFLHRFGWYWEKAPDAIGYYISLEGAWDDYLNGLGSHTRKEWRRHARHLSSVPGYAVERISDPKQMHTALGRFVRLEQSGWKAQAGIGAGKDERHVVFYEDLLVRLAEKGQATIYFLKSSAEDIAAGMCFIQRDVVTFRHTTYSPAYSAHSPGVVLQAEILQELFGGIYRELDLEGMRERGPAPRLKTEWATGRRETVHLTGYRVFSRLLPLVVFKRLRSKFMKRSEDEGQGRDILVK